MPVSVGDTLLDGKVVIVSVDANGLITSIKFPSITDTFGTPLTVTFNPGQAVGSVILIAELILGQNP